MAPARVLLLAAGLAFCSGSAAAPPPRLVARAYDSGFAQAHDTYNGMGTASDGRIYYVLSSDLPDVAARMFSFDPADGQIRPLGDLSAACGEKDRKVIAQGKSHVNFVEASGKLYFASHIGFYSIIGGKEKMGIPPPGFEAYQGGHLLAWDLKTGQFEDLAVAPNREGIITMNMDPARGRIYGLTWPTGYFLRYDLARRELRNLGPFFLKGEDGAGPTYRTICRSLAVNPDDGSAYFTTGDGVLHRYRCERDAVEDVAGDNLRKDYFGLYDVTSAGHMAYNWRQVVWRAADKCFYGVHGNSGYLFRFDPRAERIELLARITSRPSQRSGMFDQFSYGYLGFALGPDGRTLYYLTGGPIYEAGRRVAGKESTAKGEARGRENLHLVTYDIPAARYTDHGPIFLDSGDRPAYVNSIAVGRDGAVYFLSRVTTAGRTRADLVRLPPVLR